MDTARVNTIVKVTYLVGGDMGWRPEIGRLSDSAATAVLYASNIAENNCNIYGQPLIFSEK